MIYDYYAINESQENSPTLSDLPNCDTQNPNTEQGSKPEWILPYLLFCRGKYNVHSLRSTSGATHAKFLTARSPTSHFPPCISRGGTWLGFKQAITQTEDECATIVPSHKFKILKELLKII